MCTYIYLLQSQITTSHTCESHCHNRPSSKNSPHKIISEIRKIAPPRLYSLYHQTLSNMHNPAIIEQLQCPICLNILCQPLELSCRALVCTYCLVHCFLLFNCSEVKCPCCFMQSPIQPQLLKPAPPLVQTLLKDIMVKCERCKRDVKAGDYDTHECSTLPTKVEVKMASRVLKRLVQNKHCYVLEER